MKWTGNPRPGLMAELKSVCRTVEKEVEKLEQETRTVASTMAMGGGPGRAGEQLRQDTLELQESMRSVRATVAEQSNDLASFLEEMHSSAKEFLDEVGQAEEFMSQYGYRPATRMDTELLLDWGRQPAPVATVDTAPPAASEFCEEAAEGECPAPALLSPAPAPVLSTDSPTIFDIGLSKQSLNLMLQNKPRLEGAAVNTAITAKFDTASHTEKSVNQNHDRLVDDGKKRLAALTPPAPDFLEDSQFAASPVLKLSSKLRPALESSMSITLGEEEIDITEGITNQRRTADSKLPLASPGRAPLPALPLDSPELPELLTMDVRKLLNGAGRRITPTEPVLLGGAGLTRARRDTPEMPELSFLKEGSKPASITPEMPELSSMRINHN